MAPSVDAASRAFAAGELSANLIDSAYIARDLRTERCRRFNAALGCAQLEQLPRFLKQKRRLAQTYADAFAHVDGLLAEECNRSLINGIF